MLASLALATVCLSSQDQVRFYYAGPMSSLMTEGKTPGTSTSGLPFDITVSDNGSKIGPTDFELHPPGTNKTIHVKLSDASFSGGHLTAKVRVSDETDTSIEGVRLDIDSATESYKGKDASGKEVILSRPESVAIASPLFFGDLGPHETSDDLAIDASTVSFNPVTTQVDVHAKLSGLRYDTTLHMGDNTSRGHIDVNSRGQVFMSTNSSGVVRIDKDGSNLTVLCKMPDQNLAMAVDPKTGRIAANCGNHAKIFLYSPSGDELPGIEGDSVLETYAAIQRWDSEGRLWSSVGGSLVRFTPEGKIAEKITKFGDFDYLDESPFDVASDGSIVAVMQDSLFRLAPDHKFGKLIAKGPAWKLGQLLSPQGVRVDSHGNIYVSEYGDNTPQNPARVSVFDKNGNFVRTFGRGAKAPKDGYPDSYWDSEVNQPFDIAFGPDGRVYVSANGDMAPILVFQPF